eukprot:SAG22_NODE_520_length_9508_cov_1.914869_3_plen_85_part_00
MPLFVWRPGWTDAIGWVATRAGGFAPIAEEIFYVDTGLYQDLTPYPNNPTKTDYTKLGDRAIWPRVQDPHQIGSEAVPWVRPRL